MAPGAAVKTLSEIQPRFTPGALRMHLPGIDQEGNRLNQFSSTGGRDSRLRPVAFNGVEFGHVFPFPI